jgi:PAS domain S-box-containing protein
MTTQDDTEGTPRDLIERSRSQEHLMQSEEMFRLLVASVKDYAIFMLDPGGNVMSWNEGAERIKGYRADEVIGKNFSVFYTPEERESGTPGKLLERAARDGRCDVEGWRVRKDGSRFWAHVVITAVHDAEGRLRGFAKVTRDNTVRKQAEEMKQAFLDQRDARMRADQERQLAEAASRAAQEANEAKNQFLMMLSHELKTPLTSIVGWSQFLSGLEPDDEMAAEAIQSIRRSAEMQARLVNDVLDISRIVAGKLRLELGDADVAAVMRDVVAQVEPAVASKSIRLEVAIPDDLGTAHVDRARLEQIVWNLLDNAVKFTPEQGRIRLSASRSGEFIEIVVADEGMGIPPPLLERIFHPFSQADMGVTRRHGGLGLGLTIVRHLVEAHGGSITPESEGAGKGATFRVTLPVTAVVNSVPDTRIFQ